MIKTPYLELFLLVSINASVVYIVIFTLILIVFSVILVYTLLNDKQVFATIFAASTAFIGVMLSIAIQSWMVVHKNNIERQQESLNEIIDYYEKMIQLLKNPGYFSLDEISMFIRKFVSKVKMYGSTNVLYQWKRLK